jgi:hypothetical protein
MRLDWDGTTVRFELRNDAGTNPYPTPSASISNGSAWHFLAGVRKTSAPYLELYVDGVSVGTSDTNASGAITTDDSLVGVNRASLSNYFSGSMDDVRIYNRALSADEIKRLYNMGR